MESGSWLDQEAPIWLLLFHTKDLLCSKHWSRGEERAGQRRGSLQQPLACVSTPHPPHRHTHSSLTQEQVEDPGGHLTGTERWHQAAEVRLPLGLQLPCHCPVGVKDCELRLRPRPPTEACPSWYLCTASSESGSGSGGSSTGISTGTSGSSGTTGNAGASGSSAQALGEHGSWVEQGRWQL